MNGVIRCMACSSDIHEKEDCPYRDPARGMRRDGIDITPRELREITEAAQ